MRQPAKATVGVFGIGLAAYWPQFPGMKERLEGYQGEVEERMRGFGGGVVAGPGGYAGRRARGRPPLPAGGRRSHPLLRGDLCHIIAGAARSAKNAGARPGAEPAAYAALDYARDTAEWLANCSVCCVPEIANAFARGGNFRLKVSGHGLRASFTELSPRPGARSKTGAARPAWRALCGRRASAFWATPIPACSTCMRTSRWCTRNSAPTSKCLKWTIWHSAWQPPHRMRCGRRNSCASSARGVRDRARRATEQLEWAARVAVGLDRLAGDFALDGVTYYYRGLDGNEFRAPGSRADSGQYAADGTWHPAPAKAISRTASPC